jgi:2-methylcitrate dehydratase PrpD
VLERLLSFAFDSSFDDFPSDVISQAKRCIIDWVGVTLGGLNQTSSVILVETVKELGGEEHATILGTSVKTSLINAALANGAMSHVLDFDDTHLGALMHPSAPLLSALLAYGEWKAVNGRDFLLAFLVGFEIETRISMAMGDAHYDVGWHSTATMGRFGAAAGVGKLAGLTRKEMACALSLAGNQSAGIRQVFGSMTKSFNAGKAASDGLLSMLIAQKGYTAPPNILQGEKGLGFLLSSDFNPQRGLEGLCQSYMIMGVTFKPYASCLYTHPAIDAAISLRKKHQFKLEEIEAIRCNVSKFCYDVTRKDDPQNGLEAKFSTPYCVSLALAEGRVEENCFLDEKIEDPTIRLLMGKVHIEEKLGLSEKEAEVTIELRGRRKLTHRVHSPIGSPENPLSDLKLEAKARSLLKPIFSQQRIDLILEKLWAFESIENTKELISLLSKES